LDIKFIGSFSEQFLATVLDHADHIFHFVLPVLHSVY
jgi:hypothetical protein